MPDPEQIQIGHEGVLAIIDLLFICRPIVLERVVGEVGRSEFQDGITVRLQRLVAPLRGVNSAGRCSPQDELRVNILSDSRNQVLTVQSSFEESQNWWELCSSHPVLCRHVVAVDVERAEDWTPLRACNLVLLFHFLPVLLLPIWVLR